MKDNLKIYFSLLFLLPFLLFACPPNPFRKADLPKIIFPPGVEKPEKIKRMKFAVRKNIVILCDFADNIHTYSPIDFNRLLFREGASSLRDYYREVSYGNLSLEGLVTEWQRMDRTYSFYVADSFGVFRDFPNNSQGLIYDLISKIDPDVNFRDFDNDGDGYVDCLIVVHAGPGAEETGNKRDFWSHKWQLSDNSTGCPGPYFTNDGVYIDAYTLQPERFADGDLMTIGVFAHELGHILGLPDLYDTDYSSNGLGIFCLMAAGSWAREDASSLPGSSPVHLVSWCKYLLGWLNPDSLQKGYLEEKANATLSAVCDFPSAYRLLENPFGVDWSWENPGTGEYFLVENRYRRGFDKGLPGSGLLILHIDETRRGNDNERAPLVGILRPGKIGFSLPSYSWGEESDLWKNDTTGFTEWTIPNSNFYSGLPSGVRVRNISSPGEVMSVDLAITPVLLGKVYAYPNPFLKGDNKELKIYYCPSDTERMRERPPFKVHIYTLAGEHIKTVDGVAERRVAYWDLKNSQGKEVAGGLYLYVIEIATDGRKERQRGFFSVVK
ncbi:MAG: M6 family metalloprotease domain-containing protein [candidate division WOR-3 bacterium]